MSLASLSSSVKPFTTNRDTDLGTLVKVLIEGVFPRSAAYPRGNEFLHLQSGKIRQPVHTQCQRLQHVQTIGAQVQVVAHDHDLVKQLVHVGTQCGQQLKKPVVVIAFQPGIKSLPKD